MAKWIQTAKTIYDLDSDKTITLKGDVNNLNWFDKYYYTIYIGSGGTEFKVAEKKTAADFSGDGFSFAVSTSGTNNFAKIATPAGQSCYIRAVGVAGSKTVEYRTYITLKAPKLSPGDFTLTVSAVNEKVAAFGTYCAVVGFSKVKVDIKNIRLAYSSWIKKISFSLPFFENIDNASETSNSKKTTQTVTSGIVDKAGNFTLVCTVMTNFGYSVTKDVTFHISDYGAPTLRFEDGAEPARTSDANGTALDRSDAKKDWKYGFRMNLIVNPHTVVNLKGNTTIFNKIIAYSSTQKAYITLTDLATKAVAYFQSSSETNAVIDSNGVLETYYKSGTTEKIAQWPSFNDGTTGLFTYHAYLLKILVKDSTGTVYTLTARVPSMTTTLHLRRGGRGVAVGGYSEGEDDLFESNWKFRCHDSIEAAGDDNVNTFGGKGTVKGKFVEATSKFKLNNTEVTGIGTGANQLALGNHKHGIIKNNGTVDTANAVMISDAQKALKMITKIPFANLAINADVKNVLADGSFEKSDTSCKSLIDLIPSFKENPIGNVDITVKDGKPGNEKSGLCYADHQHPYSREWMNDPLIVKIIQSILTALTGYV